MSERCDAPRCLCLTGVTATGKTELALGLADAFGAEIISMDSAMVYRGMDIGTAKPPASVLERIPHHLVDILEPEQPYSAGQFATDATARLRELHARGKPVLIVGGTLLYLRALTLGLADLPERDPDVRAAIDDEAEQFGWPALHAKLAGVDPETAARIEPADKQRIQRALEVYELTGRTLSELQAKTSATAGRRIDTVALIPEDREQLKARIELRFARMVEAGFVDEVRALKAREGLSIASPSMRAVGYRQIWAHLDGEYGWEETRERALAATRQLAKRQLTWLRSERVTRRLSSGDPGLENELQAWAHKAFER